MISQFVARQLGNPSGWFGKQVVSRVLNRGNQELIESCIQKLELVSNDHFLDLGFGGGASLILALKRIQSGNVVGIDRSHDMIKRGQKKFHPWIDQGRLDLLWGDVSDLPCSSSTFSKILTTNTVYFWPDLLVGFRELHRVLRDQGTLCIGISGPEKMHTLHWVTRHGFRIYSPNCLCEQLEKTGFSNVQSEALSGKTTQGDWIIVANRD